MKCPNCGRPIELEKLPKGIDGIPHCPYCQHEMILEAGMLEKKHYSISYNGKRIEGESKEELFQKIREDKGIPKRVADDLIKKISRPSEYSSQEHKTKVAISGTSVEELVRKVEADPNLSEEKKKEVIKKVRLSAPKSGVSIGLSSKRYGNKETRASVSLGPAVILVIVLLMAALILFLATVL